ncbi:siroheme decarboxylase subunit beta [Profundibacter sp.]
MAHTPDPVDQRLLDEWQRDFPLVSRPFASIGQVLGLSEDQVITRLDRLKAAGAISRIGATIRPNTIAASTLAAIAVPEKRLDEVAAIVGAEEGVNHSYLREHRLNLWFVATAPDDAALQASLKRIENASGLPVLGFPLLRAFNIDLGFSLENPKAHKPDGGLRKTLSLDGIDRLIMQALTQGLLLVSHPFAMLADDLGLSETVVLNRIRRLSDAGYLTRVGVILRHRALGWRSNAMVAWQVPVDRIIPAGEALAALPGVTLCYQRQTVPDVWPYTLYCMIHARSRHEAMDTLTRATELPELQGVKHEVLFSTHCFKQTGAMIAHSRKAAQ